MKSTSFLLVLGLTSSAVAGPMAVKRQYQDDCTDEITADPVPATSTSLPVPYGTGYSYGSGGSSWTVDVPIPGTSVPASIPNYSGSYSYGIPSSSEASAVTPTAGPSGSYPVYGNGSSNQPTAGPGTGIPGTSQITLTKTVTVPGSPTGSYPTGTWPASADTPGNSTSPAGPTGSVPGPYSPSGTAVSPVTPSSNSTLPQPTSPAPPSSYPPYSYSYGTGGPSSSTNDANPVTGSSSPSSSAIVITDSFPAPPYTVSVSPITSIPSPPIVTGGSSSLPNTAGPATGSGSSGFVTSAYPTKTPPAVPSYGYGPGSYTALPYNHAGHRGQGDSQSWWGSWFGQGNGN